MELWELSARETVRHTIASYTYAADHGRFEDVASLFAVDGILEVHGTGGARAVGRHDSSKEYDLEIFCYSDTPERRLVRTGL